MDICAVSWHFPSLTLEVVDDTPALWNLETSAWAVNNGQCNRWRMILISAGYADALLKSFGSATSYRHKSINYPSNRSNSARNTVRVPASSCREERFRHQTLAEYPKQGNPTHPTPPYLLSLRRFPSAPSPILQLTSASPSPNHRWKMLCSISAGKSDSTWLDRLRTSKGFPTQNGLDLDHFLNPNPNLKPIPDQNHAAAAIPEASDKSIVDRRKKSSTSPAPSMAAEKNSEDWFDIMSCVLSELFNMGDASRVPALESRTKKSSRKQPNPRICALSASASVDDSCLAGVPAMSPSSVDNSVAEAKEPRKQGVAECVNPEDEILQVVGADTDLSSFSRSEVTIIDTSAPVWKSEKLIYRKGNVWKIREKKRNSWNGSASRKKRKLGQRDGSGGEDMQQKPPISPSALVKEAGNNGHFVSSHEENDRESEVQSFNKHIDLGYCSDLLKELNPINLRSGINDDNADKLAADFAYIKQLCRPQFSRSPRKPVTKDSPVLLAHCIPTGRKTDAYGQKSHLKLAPLIVFRQSASPSSSSSAIRFSLLIPVSVSPPFSLLIVVLLSVVDSSFPLPLPICCPSSSSLLSTTVSSPADLPCQLPFLPILLPC
ncbi:hypothetical protein ACLOJK_006350 [Asimina triloba]